MNARDLMVLGERIDESRPWSTGHPKPYSWYVGVLRSYGGPDGSLRCDEKEQEAV